MVQDPPSTDESRKGKTAFATSVALASRHRSSPWNTRVNSSIGLPHRTHCKVPAIKPEGRFAAAAAAVAAVVQVDPAAAVVFGEFHIPKRAFPIRQCSERASETNDRFSGLCLARIDGAMPCHSDAYFQLRHAWHDIVEQVSPYGVTQAFSVVSQKQHSGSIMAGVDNSCFPFALCRLCGNAVVREMDHNEARKRRSIWCYRNSRRQDIDDPQTHSLTASSALAELRDVNGEMCFQESGQP
nr:hypothetical protein CFP56_21619 [Quercus suber]